MEAKQMSGILQNPYPVDGSEKRTVAIHMIIIWDCGAADTQNQKTLQHFCSFRCVSRRIHECELLRIKNEPLCFDN